jgi:hypothetical protein
VPRDDPRRREARCALLVFIAAIDDTPLAEIGDWLMELGAALAAGVDVPDGADLVKTLRGELETSTDAAIATLAQRFGSTTRES